VCFLCTIAVIANLDLLYKYSARILAATPLHEKTDSAPLTMHAYMNK